MVLAVGCEIAGDNMDLASLSANYSSANLCEADRSFGCPVDLDDCTANTGKNPIHSCISYGDDNSIDQFTPGQKLKMQQAWETYCHKLGYSKNFSLAEDRFSCMLSRMPFPSNKTLK